MHPKAGLEADFLAHLASGIGQFDLKGLAVRRDQARQDRLDEVQDLPPVHRLFMSLHSACLFD